MARSTVESRPGATIDSLLLGAVRDHGARPALAFEGIELDYRTLDAAVERLAAGIARAAAAHGGAESVRGARVAVIGPNVPALVAALFACWRLDAVAVPLNARLREREVTQILADSEARVVVSVRSHLGYSFADLMTRLAARLPGLCACLFVDALGELEDEMPGAARPHATEPLEPDIAAILYTSGTTGLAKGALVRHVREAEGAARLGGVLGLTADDVSVFIVPISHAFGLTSLLATVATGGTAALVDSTFSPRALLAAVDERAVSVLHGSPTLFAALLKARPAGVPSLRTGFVAGAPPPAELFERMEGTGASILNLYGLTESGAVACCRLDDPPEIRATTAGRPLPGIELRIEPGEDGDPSIGEVQLRGPYLTPGYYRRTDETASAFVDGWFRTGDLGRLADGYLAIRGRAKDVVHVAGFNVFPAEVEAALLSHDDVVQACVVGVSHPTMGEALTAFVVLRAGARTTPAALLQFARGKIAGYKLPYMLTALPELPLLATGKPDRLALRELAADTATARRRDAGLARAR